MTTQLEMFLTRIGAAAVEETKRTGGRMLAAGFKSLSTDLRNYGQIAEWYSDEIERRIKK